MRGDITTLVVDAIINSANPFLVVGGGIDGAIHAIAGSRLIEAYRQTGGCKEGSAVLTPGFDLKAKYVIHTVSPQNKDGNSKNVLKMCYWNCLEVAKSNNIKTIAFPLIGTGIMGFSIEESKEIALSTIDEFIKYYKDRDGVWLQKIILTIL